MRVVLFGMLFFTFISTKAQEFRTDVSYKYMFSNKWDKAIQTYNFSRPFIETKQPLLIVQKMRDVSFGMMIF